MPFADILLWIIYFFALYFAIFLLSIFLFEPKIQLRRFKIWPKASIIIPAWNEEESLAETIDSALALDYPKEKLEVIVVDHGSTDKTGEIADNYSRKIKVLHLGRQSTDNKSVAINNALKYVTGEFVACLDADSIVAPQSLKEMLPYFNSSSVAAVTPTMLAKKPTKLLQKFQRYEYMLSVFIKRIAAHLNCVYVAPGPFSIYRTKMLKEVGGFDEEAIAEDMEIVYRLQSHHYIIRQCLHGGYSYAAVPQTLNDLYKQRKRWYGGSISNLYKYRRLTLNKKYGDFGFFQMPKNIFGVISALAGLFFFSYFILWPILKKMYDLFLIRFDFLQLISRYKLDLSLFQLTDVPSLIIVTTISLLGFFFFFYAFFSAGEKFNKKHVIPLVMFFCVYSIILCCIYLSVVMQKLCGRKLSWQKVSR